MTEMCMYIQTILLLLLSTPLPLQLKGSAKTTVTQKGDNPYFVLFLQGALQGQTGRQTDTGRQTAAGKEEQKRKRKDYAVKRD